MQNSLSFRVLRLFLLPFAALYAAITLLRNKLYDWGVLKSVSFSVPVISVGNLSTGGTGKTPHIEYLVGRLLQQQLKIATLSRGYKRRTSGFLLASAQSNALQVGDEPLQLITRFPNITVAVGENRVAAIRQIMAQQPDVAVILLDDAFQHRRVKPALSVLLTDYNRLFTRDLPLPAGRLREAASGYIRAQVIVVTKCPDDLSLAQKEDIRKELNPKPHQTLLFSYLQYGTLYSFADANKQAQLNKQTDVLLVCALANTHAITQYTRAKARSVQTLFFADHHYYTNTDVQQIHRQFTQIQSENKIILTTEKDAMRLRLLQPETDRLQLPIYCLPVEVVFSEPDALLLQQQIAQSLTLTARSADF